MNHKTLLLLCTSRGSCEKSTYKDEVDIEMGLKPYDINDDTCMKVLNFLYKFVLILFFITSIISLVKLRIGIQFLLRSL